MKGFISEKLEVCQIAVWESGDRGSAGARNFSNFGENRILICMKRRFENFQGNALRFNFGQEVSIGLNQDAELALVLVRTDGIRVLIGFMVMSVTEFVMLLFVMALVQQLMHSRLRKKQAHQQQKSQRDMFVEIHGCKDRYCGLLLYYQLGRNNPHRGK